MLYESGAFTRNETGRPLNFGYNTNTFWFYSEVEIENTDERILSIPSSYHQYLDLYINQGEGWKKHSTGNLRPYDTRGPLKPVDFAWEFEFKAGQKVEIMVRVQSRAPVIYSIELKTTPRFHVDSLSDDLFYGLYFGALLIMFFLNFAIFLTLRRKVYLFYLLIVLTNIIVFSTVAGYSFKYIYPSFPSVNYYIREVSIAFLMIPTSLFAIHFLELKKYSKLLYYLVYGMLGVGIVVCLLIVFQDTYGWSSKIMSIHAPILLIAGIVVWLRGNKTAPIYIFAWAGYLVGGLLMVLRNAGVLPSTFYTDHGAEIGTILDVFLLALALALQYKTILKEKDALQEENFNLIENQNVELEAKVKIRTKELNNTLSFVNKQHTDLQNKTNEIAASIDYAEKIQSAILPKREDLMDHFKDVGIFYLPKEKVSGDFFFFEKEGDCLYVGVGDCTGHGVPGAMMSMLGFNLLFDAVKVEKLKDPRDILSYLDENIELRLSQNKTEVKDGMDISICAIHSKTGKARFSGAQRPILICPNDGEVEYIKGSKRAIGSHLESIHDEYSFHDFQINEGDNIFLYSDGFQDQFGGEKDKKYLSTKLSKFLISISQEAGAVQESKMRDEFHSWKGKREQVDDVIVLSLKF